MIWYQRLFLSSASVPSRYEPSFWNASLTTSHAYTLPWKCCITFVMWFFMRASRTSLVAIPPEPLENTHDGFWLCHTIVWPRTFILLVVAKLTIASALLYVKLFSFGSSAS